MHILVCQIKTFVNKSRGKEPQLSTKSSVLHRDAESELKFLTLSYKKLEQNPLLTRTYHGILASKVEQPEMEAIAANTFNLQKPIARQKAIINAVLQKDKHIRSNKWQATKNAL